MKKALLFILFALAVATQSQAQTLKELLYGGKLKMDSNSVIRKTDDLSTKIDTAQKKPEPVKATATAPVDTAVKNINPLVKTTEPVTIQDTAVSVSSTPVETVTAPAHAAAPKTNNKLWKDYTDSLVNVLKTEVLNNKKIKKETYFITVDYELDPTGEVGITNVTVTPENNLLRDQVKERIISGPPQMNSTVNTPGSNPKKVKRRYNFSITKD
jgi:hypothetical protein